ncbi:proline-rich domain-containing protein [Streptomyces sp. NPDC047028]|uniref:proline-rich domain-containing protein n=1 Tax=Streptomyces sp. NPDC047028 TaxID=3155793 RepID=UPI0033DC1F2D
MSEAGEGPQTGDLERKASDTRLLRSRTYAESDPARQIREARMREEEIVRISFQKLKDWWWAQQSSDGARVSLAAVQRTEMYGSVVRSLSRLAEAEVSEPAVQEAAVRVLEEANRDVLKALRDIDKTCQSHIIRHERALKLFFRLSQQEFLRSTATQEAYLTQRRVITANTQILIALRQKLRQSVSELEKADRRSRAGGRADRRIRELDRAAKEASNAIKAIGTQLGDVTSSTSAGLATVKVDIYAQALKAYVSQHRTERLKTLKKVDDLSGFLSRNTLALAPIGISWLAQVVETVRATAVYGTRDALIEQGRKEAEEGEFFGEVFAEYSKDPLLMATALAEQAQKNIGLLMTWLGIPAGAVGGGLVWQVLSKVVREICYAYFVRRVEAARAEIASIPPRSAGFARKVRETLEHLAKGVEADLRAQLESGDLVAKMAKTYAAGTVSESFAAQLATAIVRPVVDLVLKCLPITPAQIVTGDQLADWTAATETVMSIPMRFLSRPAPTVEEKRAPRRQIPQAELWDYSETEEMYDWTLVESDEGQSAASHGVAFIARQRVCFESNRFGFRVWAEGVRSRAPDSDIVWRSVDLVRLEAAESPGWRERTITGDGYTVGRLDRKVLGTWARLPLKNVYAFVPVSGGNPEFVRGITRTRLGTVDSLFSSVRGGKLAFWDLGPNPPGYTGPAEPGPTDRRKHEEKKLPVGDKPPPPPYARPQPKGGPGETKQSPSQRTESSPAPGQSQGPPGAPASRRPPLRAGDTCRYNLVVAQVDNRPPDAEGRLYVQFRVGGDGGMRVWGWTAHTDAEVVFDCPDEGSLDDAVWAGRTMRTDGYRDGNGETVQNLAWRNPFAKPGYLALTTLSGSVRTLLRTSARTRSGRTVQQELTELGADIYRTPLQGG